MFNRIRLAKLVASPAPAFPIGQPSISWQDLDRDSKELYDHLQAQGIPLDMESLSAHKEKVSQELNGILDRLESKYGFRPNPNQTEDYAKIATMSGYTLPTQPGTGRTKTDQWTLERAAKEVPDLKELQKARSVRRTESILRNLIEAAPSGRVYPSYHFDPTLGRAHAGGDANPMNWEEAIQNHVKLPGYRILVADYARMELIVIAVLAGDQQMVMDLRTDPYRELAKTVFKTSNPTKQQRDQAKTAFIAMIYDNTDKGIAAQLGVPLYVAQKFIKGWHQRYHVTSQFRQQLKQLGRERGFAESFHGRQKPLNKTNKQGLPDSEANDRLAINSVIQNTAADLAKRGFTNVKRSPQLKAWGVDFVTTVHDSLVMLVPDHVDIEQVKPIVKEEMVDNNDVRFPLAVNFKVGDSWGAAA